MHLALTPISDCEQGEFRREPFSASYNKTILPAWDFHTFVKLFLSSWEMGFLFLDSSEKCQSQNPCNPPSHSLVWPRNLIELETFCDTDTGHHFYCTQSPGVGSSNSTVETHLFRAYAKNTTLFLIHNIWT